MTSRVIRTALLTSLLASATPAMAFTFDFGTLGPDYTSFAYDEPLSVQAPGSETITFTASGSQFELYTAGPTLYGSQFADGTHVLSDGLVGSPLTIAFSRPLESLSFAASSLRFGAFTATFSLFDGATLISTQTIASDVEGPGMNGPLPMIDVTGFGALGQRITSATVSLSQPSNFFGPAALIGPVSYSLSTIPLPSSAPMFGAAVLALAAVGCAARRKRAA